MSLRPVRMGSWPVSSGSCGSLNGRLVLQIVTDIDFIMRLKIVNRPIKHGVHTHIKVPCFGQQGAGISNWREQSKERREETQQLRLSGFRSEEHTSELQSLRHLVCR